MVLDGSKGGLALSKQYHFSTSPKSMLIDSARYPPVAKKGDRGTFFQIYLAKCNILCKKVYKKCMFDTSVFWVL